MIFGVLGLGSIGSRHAGNLLALGERVAAYDPSTDRRDWARSQGIEPVESREALLEMSDALIIASPNGSHLGDLQDGVAAGCHCFVEKPIAHTVEGLSDVLDSTTEKELRVFCGLNLRFHPAVLEGKRLLDQNAIGAPLWASLISSHYLPGWRPQQDYRQGYTADPATGGVIFDIIHEFDLANFLLGPARTVAAVARNTGVIEIASEDCADIILAHEGGVHSTLHLDYVTRPTQRTTRIGGLDGVIEIDLVKRSVTHIDATGDVAAHHDFSATSSAEDYVLEMTAFVGNVKENTPPQCSGYEGLKVLEQVIAARRLCGLPET